MKKNGQSLCLLLVKDFGGKKLGFFALLKKSFPPAPFSKSAANLKKVCFKEINLRQSFM
jgi:hypothetical protein